MVDNRTNKDRLCERSEPQSKRDELEQRDELGF